MADLIGKVEGIAGLALIGGLAYGALRFGPEVIKSFRGALDGFKSVGAAASGVPQAANDTLNLILPGNPLQSTGDTINLITSPGSDPVDIGLSSASSIFDWASLFNPGLGKGGGLVVDLLGGFMSNTIDPNLAAAAAAKQASDAAALEHLNTLKATFKEQFEANKAAAAAQVAAQIDSLSAAVAKANQDMSDEVFDVLTAGKSSAGLTPVSYTSGGGGKSSSVTYVAPSGAYSTVQNGQIVSGGSAGSYGQPISAKEAAARAKLGIK